MQISNLQDMNALVKGMSPDIPLIQRIIFWIVAFALHASVFVLLFVTMEGDGIDRLEKSAAQDVAFYVETVIPIEVEVESEPEPEVPQSEEVEDPVESVEAEIEEILPKARISPLVIATKPKPPQIKKQVKKAAPKEPVKVTQQVSKQRSSVQQMKSSKLGLIKPSFPAYLRNPPPKYPKTAKRRRMEGVTRLWVRVNEQGRVLDLKVQNSSGHARLDQEAVRAVRNWRFIPAKKNGHAVGGEVIVPIRFRLNT